MTPDQTAALKAAELVGKLNARSFALCGGYYDPKDEQSATDGALMLEAKTAILALIARLESAERDAELFTYLSASGAIVIQDDDGFYLYWHTSGRGGPIRPSRKEAIAAAIRARKD